MLEDVEATVDCNRDGMLDALEGADVLRLRGEDAQTWGALCEHVRLPPPAAQYPAVLDIGQRIYKGAALNTPPSYPAKHLKHDQSPWVVGPPAGWSGISTTVPERSRSLGSRTRFEDDFADVQSERWLLRTDTFPETSDYSARPTSPRDWMAVSRSPSYKSRVAFEL